MPKSKVRRKPAAAPPQGSLQRQPATLSSATLALYQASLEIVREAELVITAEARAGGDTDKALDVHHHLRTGALGFLIAYSKMTGLPDPREAVTPAE